MRATPSGSDFSCAKERGGQGGREDAGSAPARQLQSICFASIKNAAISVNTSTVEGQSNCRTLEELMDELEPEMFWRVHRSFVVNIQHIREVVP